MILILRPQEYLCAGRLDGGPEELLLTARGWNDRLAGDDRGGASPSRQADPDDRRLVLP